MSDEQITRAMRLMLELRQSGITDYTVLNALEGTPRELFLEPHFADQAYEDVGLPIPCGQTISRPVTAAGMIMALELGSDKSMTVLEIGTGTGYSATILSQLCRRVFTIDRYRTLVEIAKANLAAMAITNVEVRHSDGLKGWPEAAPFDRILVSGAIEDEPVGLLAQLKPGGIMVVPLGDHHEQKVVKLTKNEDGSLNGEDIADSRFLPLLPGAAREL